MSVATISYSSLRDASSEANAVSKKLDRYADNLNSSVLRKLESYSGSYTGNIQSAKNNVRTKIDLLRSKSRAYSNYANDLGELKEECLNTDKSVRTLVSNLTATFKQSQGIRNSVVQNTINYYLTSLGNSSAAGRWLGGAKDKAGSIKEYIKQKFEDWWDYEGGKQWVKGMAVAALEIVGGICAVITGIAGILAAATVGAAIVAAAGAIGGALALMNGMMNAKNENRAYNETHNNDDPALGRRRSAEDTIQDTVRRETDSKFWHNVATGLDVAGAVCTVVSFVGGVGDLMKKAYKWTTGSMADIKNITVRDILTKDNFSQFAGKVKSTVLDGGREIKNAVKFRDLSTLKSFGRNFGSDFLNNLSEFKKGYTDYSSLAKGAKSVGKWSSLSKTLVSGDFSAKTMLKDVVLDKVILSNVGVFKGVTYSPEGGHNSGLFAYKDSNISISDIKGTFSGMEKLWETGGELKNNLFQSGGFMDKSVLNKLNTICGLSISVPEINIPGCS